MKKLIPIVLISLIIGSCSFHMEKRRYSPGYYVSFSDKLKFAKKSREEISFKSNKQVEQVTKKPSRISSDDLPPIPVTARQEFAISGNKNNPFSAKGLNSVTNQVIKKTKTITSKNKTEVPEIGYKTKNIRGATNNSSKKSDRLFLFLSGIFAVTFAAAFKPFVSATRKIGYWALNNRKLTRGLHFAGHCALAGSGYYLGGQLFDAGVTTTEATTYSLAGAASLATLLYPHRKVKKGFFRNTYFKQKMFSLFMVLSGLLLFINIGNRQAAGNLNFPAFESATNYQIENTSLAPAGNVTTPDDEEKQEKTAINILLTILTAIISLVLCVLIVGGSCALSCSGQEALAIVLLVVGLPLVIILSIHIIKSIWNPKDKKQELAPAMPK